MSDTLDQWFEMHILVHEESLMRFLGRSWPNHSELDDIRQEVYVRVYEAATKALPHMPKSFLFTTARHLIIDRIRRNRVVSIEAIGGWGELDDLNVIVDEPSTETRASARQDLQRLAVAFDGLPPRCREVLWLRRVEDLPQKEVARKLNISEGAVEKALARAVQLLAKTSIGGKVDEKSRAGASGSRSENESRHDKRRSD